MLRTKIMQITHFNKLFFRLLFLFFPLFFYSSILLGYFQFNFHYVNESPLNVAYIFICYMFIFIRTKWKRFGIIVLLLNFSSHLKGQYHIFMHNIKKFGRHRTLYVCKYILTSRIQTFYLLPPSFFHSDRKFSQKVRMNSISEIHNNNM